MFDILKNPKIWHLTNRNGFGTNYIYIAKEITDLKKNFLYQSNDPFNFRPKIDFIRRLRTTGSFDCADYILVPHPWISIRKNKEYLRYLQELSDFAPLIIANSDDQSPKCNLSNTIEIRTFLHPKENNFRKIIFPYPAKSIDAPIRDWKPVPRVSFVGFVPKLSLGSLTSKSRSFFRSPIRSSVYINRRISVHKTRSLQTKFKIECITREQFSLLPENHNLKIHVDEYKRNIRKTDYVICPRGFANTSIRFYETLSAGATPILINSGSPLPILKDELFWKTNIIQLDLFSNWEKAIFNDWQTLGINKNYRLRQLSNKKIFQKELNLESYALKIFESYLK